MKIQFNTDDNVIGSEVLSDLVHAEINDTLGRFSEHVTRVEVHLSDENGDKSGGDDKRCLMEARLAGRQPQAVSHQAGTLEAAYKGAARKLRNSLDSTLGRLNDHKGATSLRDELQG